VSRFSGSSEISVTYEQSAQTLPPGQQRTGSNLGRLSTNFLVAELEPFDGHLFELWREDVGASGRAKREQQAEGLRQPPVAGAQRLVQTLDTVRDAARGDAEVARELVARDLPDDDGDEGLNSRRAELTAVRGEEEGGDPAELLVEGAAREGGASSRP